MTRDQPQELPVFSVSELNATVRMLLEDAFSWIWVEGEISNLRIPSSGHWYFTIKDAGAQVRCVMFRGRTRYAPRSGVKDGTHVRVLAQLSLYQERGEFQLIANTIELAGTGALFQRFEALKARLAAEGLFAAERKQELPLWIRHVAILTSSTGAAIADLLRTFAQMAPSIRLTLIPVAVQGEAAAAQIVTALAWANSTELLDQLVAANIPPIDLVILGRGGGSLEDLWSFNDESLARAIVQSSLPVISAVGHETDFTIADFVADVRAATPTAAAVLVAQGVNGMLRRIAALRDRLAAQWQIGFAQAAGELRFLRSKMRHPNAQMRELMQAFDFRDERLRSAMSAQLQRLQQQQQQARLRLRNPRPSLERIAADLQRAQTSLLATMQHRLKARAQQLETQAARTKPMLQRSLSEAAGAIRERARALNAVSPLATLERGYTIVTAAQPPQEPITTINQVHSGMAIEVQWQDGRANCTVQEAIPLAPLSPAR